MASRKSWGAALAVGAMLLGGASACNRNRSDGGVASASDGRGSPTVDPGGADQSSSSGRYARSDAGGRRSGGYGRGEGAGREPAPLFHGEPMWSDNRSHSAKENAEYHFERAGADLGAKTLDEFLTKVHRFCDQPPAGTLHLTRSNGDRLLYDPRSNIFAVVTREGAPRTVFKPNDGMSYWSEQKAREEERGDDLGGGEGGGDHRRQAYRRNDSGDSYGRESRGYERRDRYSDRDEG